jgi:hypothetical protein
MPNRAEHKPTKGDTMTVQEWQGVEDRQTNTDQTHPYAIELLSGNYSSLYVLRCTTEENAQLGAEKRNYLLGREFNNGNYVAVIVTKKWTGDSWEILTETEW